MDPRNLFGRTPEPSGPRTAAGDLEAQHRPTTTAGISEMSTSRLRLIHRLRPAVPGSVSEGASQSQQHTGRPSSSRYSEDDPVSPKGPRFGSREQTRPSRRLRFPNSPPTRPATEVENRRGPVIAEPVATVRAEHIRGHGVRPRGGLVNAEGAAAETVEDGRRRRRCNRTCARRTSHRSRRFTLRDGLSAWRNERRRQWEREDELDRRRRAMKPLPKHFLFCFPWIKSRRTRNLILRCFVSGLLLALLLTVYLALSITKNINSSDFTVLLFLIILSITLFFCHGLIRLCLSIIKNGRKRDGDETRSGSRMPNMAEPGGYAIPRRPIRVLLARDQEAAGLETDTAMISPPAYGLWRQSVRVDPNRIYWAPASTAASDTTMTGATSSLWSSDATNAAEHRVSSPRPPSYVSDDGVSYVVEARPRLTVPTHDVPLASHPAETGRARRQAEW